MNFKDGKSLHDLLKSINGDLSCQCKKSDMMSRAASVCGEEGIGAGSNQGHMKETGVAERETDVWRGFFSGVRSAELSLGAVA